MRYVCSRYQRISRPYSHIQGVQSYPKENKVRIELLIHKPLQTITKTVWRHGIDAAHSRHSRAMTVETFAQWPFEFNLKLNKLLT